MKNELSFKILESLDTDDYEVRIFIDKQDLLDDEHLGLDPTPFFEQDFDKEGTLYVGRCNCGVEGCDDITVDVSFEENSVTWRDNDQLKMVFDRNEYENLIYNAKNDYSWEDIKRKVERLINNILKNTQTKDGFTFAWASARMEEGQIALSYNKDSEQKLFYIEWDGEREENAIEMVNNFLKHSPLLK